MTTWDEGASAQPTISERRIHAEWHFRAAQIFHWVTALGVGLLAIAGVSMKQLGPGQFTDTLYTLHKTIGFTVLCLVATRLIYRAFLTLTGRWRSGVGRRWVHALLYGLLLAVPLIGLAGVSDFGARGIFLGLSLPEIWPYGSGHADTLFQAHAYLAFLLLGLVVIHIGVALGDYLHRGSQRGVAGRQSHDE